MRRQIVRIEDVKKRYPMPSGTVEALRGVSLTIHEGEMVAIMGRSGSGKSTLMHLLGALDRPTEGTYWLGKHNMGLKSDDDRALIRATQIGFVFQSFNLIHQLTVYENVEIPFLYQPQAAGAKRERILEALDRVGLAHRIDHLPTQLSGGEMQRVAIARALVINPMLILADEPTGNLDESTGDAILQLFSQLHAQGATIVMVTHDQKVGDFCERTIRMSDGNILEEQLCAS